MTAGAYNFSPLPQVGREEEFLATQSDVLAAAQSGAVGRLRKLLQEDPSLASAKDTNGVSAVMHAFYSGRPEIADLLLSTKPETDIFEATAASRAQNVSDILESDPEGAKRWSADGFTALHFAAFFNKPDIARSLIRRGADIAAVSKNAMRVTPLHSAATARSGEIVRLLVANGAPVNAPQQGGWTALHAAAQNGDKEMVRTLIEYRADTQAKNEEGRTPVQLAQERGQEEIVKLLSK